jgi:hypothetical protein
MRDPSQSVGAVQPAQCEHEPGQRTVQSHPG